jgi:hypothetical protein
METVTEVSSTPETVAPQVAPVAQSAPDSQSPVADVPISASDIKKATLNRDVKTVKEQFEKITGRVKQNKQTEKSEQQKLDIAPKEPVAENTSEPVVKKGKFVIGDGSDKIELNDPDGLLGYGTVEGLKKSNANQIRRIQMDNKWREESERTLLAERQRNEQLAQELEKFKTSTVKPVAEPTPRVSTDGGLSRPSAGLKIEDAPKPPTLPDLPDDPMEWDDKQLSAKKTFDKERAEYDLKMKNWVEGTFRKITDHASELAKVGIANDTNNPLVKDIVEMKKTLAELQNITNDVKKTKEQLEVERKTVEYWSEIEDFQKQHDDIKTPVSMKDLHKQIWEDGTKYTWMDYVALSNNVPRPTTNDVNAWNQYHNKRYELTQKYLDGDKSIIEKCESAGVEPPEGYKEYFSAAYKLRDIDAEHRRLKEQGLLGPKSTRQMAWEYSNKGNLTNQIQTMERKAHADGASTVINALTQHRAEHAVVIPPNISQGGSTPFSGQQVQDLLRQSIERRNDPEFKKMLDEITKRKK